VTDRPGQLAVTSNATRAYVPLERSGRVAVVDLLARREVDAEASTPTVDDINLPNGASPGAISIDPWDNYACVTDSGRGSIYVLDVNPGSVSYNQVVEIISVDAKSGLRQIAISSDGRKLFATAADGYIYAVNIDPEDRPSVPNSNPRKWWEQIGKVSTPNGAFGLAATPDPLKMVFTSGNKGTDGNGFGVLTVSDNPLNLAPTTRYTNLTLGSEFDVFDVNEGVAVTVTADGKYAFVAGSNSQKIIWEPQAGGNIGIIKDPLGPNPQLVAATEPVPGVFTNNVALSSDGKYLIASNLNRDNSGSADAYNVKEITKAIENAGGTNLTDVPLNKIAEIVDKTFASGGSPLGLVVAQITAKQPDPVISKMSFVEKLKAAIKLVPGLLVGDASAGFQQLVSNPEFIAELVAVGVVFAALQAVPVLGQAIDAALIIAFGFSAGFNLGSFFLNVFKAQDKQGLQAAANNFKNFLEAVGVLAVTGALKLAGRVLRAIKEGGKASTVWNAIKATQPVYERTVIPRSFELTVGREKFWVAPNATEHFPEQVLGYIRSKGSDRGAELFTQFLLEDFRQAVAQAVQQGITYGQRMRIGKWELISGPLVNPVNYQPFTMPCLEKTYFEESYVAVYRCFTFTS
jgi:hypothetical protein